MTITPFPPHIVFSNTFARLHATILTCLAESTSR